MSIRFQADNDLKFGIVKAARRREPSMDFVSAQEANLDGMADPELLDRATSEGRGVIEALVYIWALADPIELHDQAYYLPSFSRHFFIR